MLNLLPTEDRVAARAEYRRRLWSMMLAMSFFVFVCGALLLLPSLAKVNYGIKKAGSDFDILSKKPAVSDYRDMENTIKEVKVELDVLNKQIAAHTNVADEIERVLKNKPSGIKVENITWLRDEKGEELALNGKAANRDSLNKYFKVLSSDSAFSKVSLPISDFAKSEGAQFSITINLNKTADEIKK